MTPEAPTLRRVGPGEAEVALLGVPFDGTSGRHPRQAHAPELVRSALYGSDPAARAPDQGVLPCWDLGDVRAEPLAVEPTDRRIRATLDRLRSTAPQALPCLLGGEHTVTLSAVRALSPATIVSLDAHPDLWDEQNGRSVAHGTWLRRAVETLGCEAVLPLARAARGAEADAIDELGVRTEMPAALPEPVYLTVDVDAFDPEDAPSVAYPEPDGPSVEAVLTLVEGLASSHALCGVDVVEVNATRVGPTARLAAGTLARAAAYARERATA